MSPVLAKLMRAVSRSDVTREQSSLLEPARTSRLVLSRKNVPQFDSLCVHCGCVFLLIAYPPVRHADIDRGSAIQGVRFLCLHSFSYVPSARKLYYYDTCSVWPSCMRLQHLVSRVFMAQDMCIKVNQIYLNSLLAYNLCRFWFDTSTLLLSCSACLYNIFCVVLDQSESTLVFILLTTINFIKVI